MGYVFLIGFNVCSVLSCFLIFSFVNIACILFLFQFEFIPISLIVIYVGAIAILFLFVYPYIYVTTKSFSKLHKLFNENVVTM